MQLVTTTWSEDELQSAAHRCANTYAQIANEMFYGCNIEIPVNIGFNLCETDPKHAGMVVNLDEMLINMIIYSDNPEEFLNQVITHEIAHIVIHKVLHGVKEIHSHGPEWRYVMQKLGKPSDRFHKMDTSRAKEWHKEFKNKKKKNDDVDSCNYN